jgi:hypothetical protein
MCLHPCMFVKDRRNARRVKLRQPIRVRPASPKDGEFEDINQTENASKRGIFFQTPILSYFVGMRVYVTLPYLSKTDPKNREYFGQVIRVDTMEKGKRGVAVQLL